MHRAVIAQCRIDGLESAARRGSTLKPAARRAFGIAALFVVPFVALQANAADEQPTGGRVPTITRLVKLFVERESAIGAAIRNGDARALGDLLTDDFEMRTGARAAAPVSRAEWMREVLRTRDGGKDIGRMAVHDYRTVQAVSFTMTGTSGPIFVIDLWRQDGESLKLAVRYASPIGSSQFAAPGAGAPELEFPKKY